jgi:hypothetical protein
MENKAKNGAWCIKAKGLLPSLCPCGRKYIKVTKKQAMCAFCRLNKSKLKNIKNKREKFIIKVKIKRNPR